MLRFLRLFQAFRDLEAESIRWNTERTYLSDQNTYLQSQVHIWSDRFMEVNREKELALKSIANVGFQAEFGVPRFPEAWKLPEDAAYARPERENYSTGGVETTSARVGRIAREQLRNFREFGKETA